jgi:hypothetical protein
MVLKICRAAVRRVRIARTKALTSRPLSTAKSRLRKSRKSWRFSTPWAPRNWLATTS